MPTKYLATDSSSIAVQAAEPSLVFSNVSPLRGSVDHFAARYRPLNPNWVYISAEDFNIGLSGLYISSDAGATWIRRVWPNVIDPNSGYRSDRPYPQMFDVAQDGVIYTVVNTENFAFNNSPDPLQGLYASKDNGLTWLQVIGAPNFPDEMSQQALGGFLGVWAGPTKLWISQGWYGFNVSSPDQFFQIKVLEYSRSNYSLLSSATLIDADVSNSSSPFQNRPQGHIITGPNTATGRVDSPVWAALESSLDVGVKGPKIWRVKSGGTIESSYELDPAHYYLMYGAASVSPTNVVIYAEGDNFPNSGPGGPTSCGLPTSPGVPPFFLAINASGKIRWFPVTTFSNPQTSLAPLHDPSVNGKNNSSIFPCPRYRGLADTLDFNNTPNDSEYKVNTTTRDVPCYGQYDDAFRLTDSVDAGEADFNRLGGWRDSLGNLIIKAIHSSTNYLDRYDKTGTLLNSVSNSDTLSSTLPVQAILAQDDTNLIHVQGTSSGLDYILAGYSIAVTAAAGPPAQIWTHTVMDVAASGGVPLVGFGIGFMQPSTGHMFFPWIATGTNGPGANSGAYFIEVDAAGGYVGLHAYTFDGEVNLFDDNPASFCLSPDESTVYGLYSTGTSIAPGNPLSPKIYSSSFLPSNFTLLYEIDSAVPINANYDNDSVNVIACYDESSNGGLYNPPIYTPPAPPATITDSHLLTSLDAGASFTVDFATGAQVFNINKAMGSIGPKKYGAIHTANNILRSTDGGLTWTRTNASPLNDNQQSIDLVTSRRAARRNSVTLVGAT